MSLCMISKESEKKLKALWLSHLGSYIKKVRLEKGYSGAELARELYIDKPNLTRLEKGRVNPSIYLLKQICDVLGITLEEFFGGFNQK
jgi:putative transcriptional regulator